MKLTVDAVVFGYVENDLKVLLIKRKYKPFKDCWALAGGFVLKDESIDEAVARELKEETGVDNLFMEQLYTFGDANRDPRGRVVSVAYYGLVKPELFELLASTDAYDAQWFSISDLPELAFDHKHIIEVAYKRLQAKLTYQPIGFELLPEKFPLLEIQNLYETILNAKFDKGNFRKKMLSFGILDELNEKQSNVAHRAAKLFRFNINKYKEKLETGFYFDIPKQN
jgi:8-oxo-dGTP diphosphatase